MDPYYVVMKLPGEDKEEFLLMVPFTPRDKPNLNGWMAARMDGDSYGELHSFSFPRGETIPGPENVYARIEQNGTISNQFTLWEGAGSTVDARQPPRDPDRRVADVRRADLPRGGEDRRARCPSSAASSS